jgi:hypothetical protein
MIIHTNPPFLCNTLVLWADPGSVHKLSDTLGPQKDKLKKKHTKYNTVDVNYLQNDVGQRYSDVN